MIKSGVTDADLTQRIAELDRSIAGLKERAWSGNKLAWTWLDQAWTERAMLTGEEHTCDCDSEDWQ
jgi:hypothetical protein